MRFDGVRNCIYDNGYVVDWLSDVGCWVKRWMHWGDRDAVRRCEKVTYAGRPFIRRTEEETYARRPVAIASANLRLSDDAPVTHSLDYVASTRPYENL